jgi:SAM-dependent methyltransferase
MTGTTLQQQLLEGGMFRCPQCGSSNLAAVEDTLRCQACGSSFERRNDVIDFYANYTSQVSLAFSADDEFVAQVAKVWDLDRSPTSLLRIARILDYTLLESKGSDELTAEIQEFASRLHLDPPPQARRSVKATLDDAAINKDIVVRFIRHYIDGQMVADTELYRSFRIRNEGQSLLISDVENPVLICYHWLDSQGVTVLEFEGMRSQLPKKLEPGAEVTVVASIRTPAKPGHYRLRMCVVQEGVKWVEDLALDIDVEVVAYLPPHAYPTFPALDFAADQLAGREVVREAVQRGRGDHSPMLLEVCAGVFPQCAPLCADGIKVVCSDISFAMTQFGRVIHELYGEDYVDHTCFIAADATSDCLAEGIFDGAVMFAALHHFPDPAQFLRQLITRVRPGGFIAVLREPCEPNPWDVDYLRDIRGGINEQMFCIEEYQRIFHQAGLQVETARIDGPSFKAVLRRA